MSDFRISIDLGPVMEAGNVITREMLPRVREAVGAIAQQAQVRWADAVMNAPGVWSEEKKAYASSITWEYTGEFSARVSTRYQGADQLENGRPARDLKRMLNTSMKVRQTKTGKRYLVIPFQHNTPGNSALAPAMPAAVHAAATQLKPSSVVGQGKRLSGTGAWDVATHAPAKVNQNKYKWGSRLSTGGIDGLSDQEKKRYSGMYRFDTTGGGKVGHSTYLTFRVMHEDSKGWIVPAKPGLHLVPGVVSQLAPVADRVLREALRLDLGL